MSGLGGTGPGMTGAGGTGPVPYASDAALAEGAAALGYQGWTPGSGIEENQGSDFWQLPDGVQRDLQRPGNPGIDTPTFTNPYRTVMYAVTGIDTAVPLRALGGNSKRTYLIVQNLGPGNLFLGIGTDPAVGGANVMTLVSTQIYEQIGGGFYLPPNPWYPKGITICTAFVSPEYISLLTDTLGTNAMILEGSFSPPANSQWLSPWQQAPAGGTSPAGSTGATSA
jgi:hypothetical protein